MSDELRAVAERMSAAMRRTYEYTFIDPNPERSPFMLPDVERGDLVTLAKAYVAEHPADADELADADWLERRGFDWSACGTAMRRMCGPIEVCVTGDVVMLEKDTHLSLHWSYPGPPKVTQYYGLDDNPTRATVRRLCAALGEPLTEPPAK